MLKASPGGLATHFPTLSAARSRARAGCLEHRASVTWRRGRSPSIGASWGGRIAWSQRSNCCQCGRSRGARARRGSRPRWAEGFARTPAAGAPRALAHWLCRLAKRSADRDLDPAESFRASLTRPTLRSSSRCRLASLENCPLNGFPSSFAPVQQNLGIAGEAAIFKVTSLGRAPRLARSAIAGSRCRRTGQRRLRWPFGTAQPTPGDAGKQRNANQCSQPFVLVCRADGST